MNARECLSSPTLGTSSTSERLMTTLDPAQLLEAFAKQLSDSGWRAGMSVRRIAKP